MTQIRPDIAVNAKGMLLSRPEYFIGQMNGKRYYVVDGTAWSTGGGLGVCRSDDPEETDVIVRRVKNFAKHGRGKTSLVTTTVLTGYLNGLRANDCDVVLDEDAGTVVATDEDIIVLQAIQKGPGGPWIATFSSTDRIAWSLKE